MKDLLILCIDTYLIENSSASLTKLMVHWKECDEIFWIFHQFIYTYIAVYLMQSLNLNVKYL